MTKSTIVLAVLVGVLALALAFQLGQSSGSDVTVKNCETRTVAGWEVPGC